MALSVINRFGAASGAKFNLAQISWALAIPIGPRDWQWGEEAGLKWLKKGEVTRYLGYPFGIDIAQKEKDAKMLSQIRKHLLRWSSNKLSLSWKNYGFQSGSSYHLSGTWHHVLTFLANPLNLQEQQLEIICGQEKGIQEQELELSGAQLSYQLCGVE